MRKKGSRVSYVKTDESPRGSRRGPLDRSRGGGSMEGMGGGGTVYKYSGVQPNWKLDSERDHTAASGLQKQEKKTILQGKRTRITRNRKPYKKKSGGTEVWRGWFPGDTNEEVRGGKGGSEVGESVWTIKPQH